MTACGFTFLGFVAFCLVVYGVWTDLMETVAEWVFITIYAASGRGGFRANQKQQE